MVDRSMSELEGRDQLYVSPALRRGAIAVASLGWSVDSSVKRLPVERDARTASLWSVRFGSEDAPGYMGVYLHFVCMGKSLSVQIGNLARRMDGQVKGASHIATSSFNLAMRWRGCVLSSFL